MNTQSIFLLNINSKVKFISYIFIFLFAFTSCMKTPMACCDVPTTGTVGQSLSFSSACSMDADNFEWDFGDGSKSTDANPVHIYTTKGSYTIKLMAMSKGGKKMNQTTKSCIIN